MHKPWTCHYCKGVMGEHLKPFHEPACRTAAQMTALREVIHEALKPRVELMPEGERDKNLKCPQCYIWWPDMQAIAFHVPLCKLVNEARLVSNALRQKEKRAEEQLARIADTQEKIATALENIPDLASAAIRIANALEGIEERGILAYDAGKH